MKKSILILFVLVNLAIADFIRDDSKEVVIDTLTHLMWQDNSYSKTIKIVWSEAIIYCEALTLGGYTNWHLPNYNELFMLADRSIYNPSLNSAFSNVVSSNYYWSSTSWAKKTYGDRAWYVDFKYGSGNVYAKTNWGYVRCVRSAD